MTRARLLTAFLGLTLALAAPSADAPASHGACALTLASSDPLSCPFCGGSMDDFEAFVRRNVRVHLLTLLASRAS